MSEERQRYVLKSLDDQGRKFKFPAFYESVSSAITEGQKKAADKGRAIYVYEHGPRGKFLRLINPPR